MESLFPPRPPRPITRRAFGRAAAAPLVMAAAQGALVNSPVRKRPGRATVYINHDRHRWAYHVHAPRHVASGEPLPVVVILHGSGSEGPVYLDRAGWAAEADRAGFLAVAPDAQRMRPEGIASNVANPRRWNSGQLPPGSQRAGIDDVGFLLKMLDDLGDRWAIDPGRVYLAGHSNGGSMAFKVVDEASERFAAMASVGGHCFVAAPAPAVPLPTVFMLGSDDPLMPLAGGRSVLPWEIRDTPPFRWTTDRWAEALGASARPTKVEKFPDATRMTFGPGPNGALLLCLIVLRQGHNWPGAPDFVVERAFLGPNQSPVKATPTLWKFFDKYERG